jgi:TRAP-type C4-dicarboxylate transport system substrate-binding protein
MQSIRRFGVAALLAASLLALGSTSEPASAQRSFTFAYDQPRTTAYGIAADIFDAKLKELSGGKLSIDQFPARSSARSR